MVKLPPIHGNKLQALLRNPKLPKSDKPRIQSAIEHYEQWLARMKFVDGSPDDKIASLVTILNDYKLYLDLDVIFDSDEDFLYRQKGQLKLDNSVIEEFLPIFVTTVMADEFEQHDLSFGPTTCFSSIYFNSSIISEKPGGGFNLRQKDHDFVVGRELFIRASHDADFSQSVTKQTNIAYVAAECKTNLDKTMFQEAAATALDLKTSIPAAKYYLLCEWLDMTPISSATTAIDEIIVLRKAKRIPSNRRREFNIAEGRKVHRESYEEFLKSNPFSVDTLARFANHIYSLIEDNTEEENVLQKGHF